MNFTFPQAYENAKGWIGTDGVMDLDHGYYYMYIYYSAVPREERDKMYSENPGDLMSRSCVLFYAFAIGDGKDFSEITRMTDGVLAEDKAVKLGQSEDVSFYLYPDESPDFAASVGEYGEEYTALCAAKDLLAACLCLLHARQ